MRECYRSSMKTTMKIGKQMRKFTPGWTLISPTGKTKYKGELRETTRTIKGVRTAIFKYRARTTS